MTATPFDVGDQRAPAAPGASFTHIDMCWRCDRERGRGPLGLCSACRAELDDEGIPLVATEQPEAL